MRRHYKKIQNTKTKDQEIVFITYIIDKYLDL